MVYEQKIPDPYRVINEVGRAIDEFWAVKGWLKEKEMDGVSKNKDAGWIAPKEGRVKVNCDGAYKQDSAALGLICRNDRGEFLWGFGERVKADSAAMTEVLAVKKALVLLKELDITNADIETDCAKVFWCCRNKSAEGIDWQAKWEM